jgi:hypothetical protein
MLPKRYPQSTVFPNFRLSEKSQPKRKLAAESAASVYLLEPVREKVVLKLGLFVGEK